MTKLDQANKLRTELAKVELEVVQELVDNRKRLERELKDTNKEIKRITGRKHSTGNGGTGKRIDSEPAILEALKTAGKEGLAQNEIEGREELKKLYGGSVPKQYGKLSSLVEQKKIVKKGAKYILK